jgi:hypothetical protein
LAIHHPFLHPTHRPEERVRQGHAEVRPGGRSATAGWKEPGEK